jgi:hypothetical protein
MHTLSFKNCFSQVFVYSSTAGWLYVVTPFTTLEQ